MNWKEQIRGCFGSRDRIFAGHPNDHQRAQAMLIAAIQEGATKKEMHDAIKDFLTNEGCEKEHIEKQLREVFKVGTYLKMT